MRRFKFVFLFSLICIACEEAKTDPVVPSDGELVSMDAAIPRQHAEDLMQDASLQLRDQSIAEDIRFGSEADGQIDSRTATDMVQMDAGLIDDTSLLDAGNIGDARQPDVRVSSDAGALISDAATNGDVSTQPDANTTAGRCDGLADGTVISEGDFGACHYESLCAESGTRSRINEICQIEQLTLQEETTANGCERATDGIVVERGEYSGGCIYTDACATDGTQNRMVQTCRSGVVVVVIESSALDICQRQTDGIACEDGGFECQAGVCSCPNSAPNPCDGQCVDLVQDQNHCGACDRACGLNQRCVARECVETCGDGQIDLEAGETCDDGNNIANDGCHLCRRVATDECQMDSCDAFGTLYQESSIPIEIRQPMRQTFIFPGRYPRLSMNVRQENADRVSTLAPIQPGFGQAVAIDGDWALIGAPDGLSSATMGDAYFFHRREDVWHAHTRLTVNPSRPPCAADCEILCLVCDEYDQICGANNSSFEECIVDEPSGCEQCALGCYRGVGECANTHQFGSKVALSGDHAAIWSWHSYSSEFEYDYDPMLYLYRLVDETWVPQGTLHPIGVVGGLEWANALAMTEQTIITGYRNHEDEALIFEPIDGQWNQVQRLVPEIPEEGIGFGRAVDISANQAVVGAWYSQAVYVFSRSDDGWQQTARLTRNPVDEGARFGWRVAIDNTTIVVGFWQSEQPTVVFEYVDGAWQQAQALPHGGEIDLDGDTLVIGGRWVYRRIGEQFVVTAHLDPSAVASFSAVELSGETLLFGQAQDDLNAAESGAASALQLPLPLCYHSGACVCRAGADGERCEGRPRCGDGQTQAAESCDDGNQVDGDGCSARCTTESP